MTKNNRATSLIRIGLDIGYGVTKAITPDLDPAIFPSVLGIKREIRFRGEDIAQRYPGDQLFDDDGDWFVGYAALKHLAGGELLRLRGRSSDSNEIRLRLAKVAFGKLLANAAGSNGDVIQIVLSTGLPVGHMRNSAALKAALIGKHPIVTDQCKFVADVVEVTVMPQPQGTLYAEQLTADGNINPRAVDKRLGVADIGNVTVDATVNDDGEYIDALSGTTQSGVHLAHQRIAEIVEARDNQKPDYRRVENILITGCDKAFGETIDMSADVNQAFEPIRQAAIDLLRSLWERGADLDRILITGGGTEKTKKQITHEYPHAVAVENAQLANAQGYLNYALFLAKQG